jgi:uncharacterized protein
MKNLLVLFLFICAHTLLAQEKANFDLRWGVKVPLRDGVHLNATLYLPEDKTAPLPVIVDLTPYISDDYHARGKYFSQNGYVYAIVDCRGRGSSEGQFDPLNQEAKDGYDLVEWMAAQPFCNGKVTMWGGSYSGYNQWATAKEFPPHLATIVPVASVNPGIDYPNPGNIFMSYMISWLTFTSGKTGNSNIFAETPFWQNKYQERYEKNLPFSQLDKLAGNETTVFQTWLKHPSYDAYWQNMSPQREHFEKMNIPILSITGHYDADQLGAITYYKNFMKFASTEAKAKKYLIIGPWDHSGTRTPHADVGGLMFGKASLLNMNQLHKEWYDHVLKGQPLPEFLKKPVAYYVTGDEQWKYADNLESIATEKRTLYFHSSGTATVFQSGALTTQAPTVEKPDVIQYNPLNTKRGIAARNIEEDDNGYLVNQIDLINAGTEAVVYHSDVFADSTELSGIPEATLYLSANVPDADIRLTLYEITANGQSILLSSQQLRLRYRESLEKETLMQPGQVYPVHLNNFTFFSRRIAAGSRLRLGVTCINSLYWQKNYGSGGDVANETAKDARPVVLNIHHEKKYPSQLIVPIGAIKK